MPTPRAHRRAAQPLFVRGAWLYLVMCVAALGIGFARSENPVLQAPLDVADVGELSLPVRVAASLIFGIAIGWTTVLASRFAVKRFEWARGLRGEFRAIIGQLTPVGAFAVALGSGVGEELFFRGALQPWLGVTITSLVFGVVHFGPTKKLLPWTLWATVMGFVFGALYAMTGVLLGCVIAHIMINFINLLDLSTFDANVDAPLTPQPSLIQRRR